MASMTAQNVVDKMRFYLNDQGTGVRWSDDELWPLVNDGVVKVSCLRPDALYDSAGALITIVPATDITSTLSIDDKFIVPVALYASAQALNKQAGQTFNSVKVTSIMEQFSQLVKV